MDVSCLDTLPFLPLIPPANRQARQPTPKRGGGAGGGAADRHPDPPLCREKRCNRIIVIAKGMTVRKRGNRGAKERGMIRKRG